MRSRRPSSHALRRWLPLAFAAASLAGSAVMWGFVVDDAFISIRYARHLAMGMGYRFDAHGPSTDGVTPLPWPVLLWPLAHGSAVEVLWRVKALGVALHALAAWLVGVRVAAIECGVAPKLAALALLGACLPLAAYGPSGMETPLATALCAASVLAMRRPRLAALAAGLAAAVRPELCPWALAVGVGLGWAEEPRSRRAKSVAMNALIAVAPFAACALVRLLAFGRVAPLAVLAKPSDATHGLVYAIAGLAAAGTPLVLIAPLALRRASPEAKTFAIAFGVHVLAIIAAGGDWMPYARLLVPVLPTVAFVLVDTARVGSPVATVGRVALAASLSVWVFVTAAPAGRHVMRDRLDLVARATPVLAAALPRVAPPARIAATDIGWVSAASEADIVDLAGLTDPDFAALPGGHTSKRVDGSMLLDRDVGVVVLWATPLSAGGADVADWRHARYGHQVAARLAHDPVMASHFTGYTTLPLGTAGAGYVVLVRSAAGTVSASTSRSPSGT